jgi:predicted phosphate transport protein (TIGR00153 family)
MRVPILRMIRKSPFDGLLAHAQKARECINKLKQAVGYYAEKRYEEFEKLAEEILKLENEADWIKGNIRNHLPRGIFMPVGKTEFLACLKEQDDILDLAEDAVIWLGFHKSEIPKEIREPFLKHVNEVVEIVNTLTDVIGDVRTLVGPISKGTRKEVKQILKDIHLKEHKTDESQHELAKKLFALGGDFSAAYHLLHATLTISQIADHAENAADIIRVMLAR